MNPFIDKILGAVGLQRKDVALASGIEVSPFAIWSGAKKIDANRAMAVNTGWVYACVRAIAEEIAKIDFRLFEVSANNDEEIFDNELLDLLNSVNPHQTRYELLYNTAAHLELTGNAYWLLIGANGEPVKSETEKPVAIYVLDPRYTRPIKAPLPEFIKGYAYQIEGNLNKFETYQVLHFKSPDPSDPYEGVGTVAAIAEWIDGDNYASAFNTAYFRNGARLGGTLESENAMSVDQQKLLKTSFESLYKGATNAYKVAVLPKGIKYNELAASPKEMDFGNLQGVLRDKILAGFRVPKTILGTSESETNRATAETADYVFSERTIKPKMEMVVQMLNEFLVPRFGDNLYLDFHSPTPEDMTAKMAQLTAALPGQASMSINEARETFFGLGPIEGGDEVMGNFSLVPIGAPNKQAKRVNVTGAKKKANRKPAKTVFAKNAQRRKKIGEEITEGLAKVLAEHSKRYGEVRQKIAENVGAISTMPDEEYEVLYKAFAVRVTPYEKLVVNAIRKFNKQQKEVVLGNLPKHFKGYKSKAPTSAQIAEDLLGSEDWLNILVNLADPALTDLYAKEAKEAAAVLGTEFALTDEVKKAIKRALSLMSDSYNATTLDTLGATIAEGLKEGIGLDEMASKISNIYEFSDDVRAQTVARTEVFRIANDSTKEAWKQSGVVESIKWYTAADERVCPYCGPMHAKIVAIDQNFYDKGATVTGEDGSTLKVEYDSVSAPPLHVNCRCYIRPEKVSLE